MTIRKMNINNLVGIYDSGFQVMVEYKSHPIVLKIYERVKSFEILCLFFSWFYITKLKRNDDFYS